MMEMTKEMRDSVPKLMASEILSVQPMASDNWCNLYNELKEEYNKTKHEKED
jgi:hypothetical protein